MVLFSIEDIDAYILAKTNSIKALVIYSRLNWRSYELIDTSLVIHKVFPPVVRYGSFLHKIKMMSDGGALVDDFLAIKYTRYNRERVHIATQYGLVNALDEIYRLGVNESYFSHNHSVIKQCDDCSIIRGRLFCAWLNGNNFLSTFIWWLIRVDIPIRQFDCDVIRVLGYIFMRHSDHKTILMEHMLGNWELSRRYNDVIKQDTPLCERIMPEIKSCSTILGQKLCAIQYIIILYAHDMDNYTYRENIIHDLLRPEIFGPNASVDDLCDEINRILRKMHKALNSHAKRRNEISITLDAMGYYKISFERLPHSETPLKAYANIMNCGKLYERERPINIPPYKPIIDNRAKNSRPNHGKGSAQKLSKAQRAEVIRAIKVCEEQKRQNLGLFRRDSPK